VETQKYENRKGTTEQERTARKEKSESFKRETENKECSCAEGGAGEANGEKQGEIREVGRSGQITEFLRSS
jgi:hypothetical protein